MSTVIFTQSTKIFKSMMNSIVNAEGQPYSWTENAKGEIIVRKRTDDGTFCRVPAGRVAVFHEQDRSAYKSQQVDALSSEPTETPKTKATAKKK